MYLLQANRITVCGRVPIPCKQDPNLLRPADVTLQIPCTDKFEKATGWKPRYSFEESLESLLLYWRERVGKEQDV